MYYNSIALASKNATARPRAIRSVEAPPCVPLIISVIIIIIIMIGYNYYYDYYYYFGYIIANILLDYRFT